MKKVVKKTPKTSEVWGSPAKRDQYTVVLEDLRSQFKVFGENLAITREVFSRDIGEVKTEIVKIHNEIAEIHAEIAEIHDEIAEIHDEIAKTNERISALDVRVAQLEQANLELLREIRQNTVSRSEFEQLREHVRKLEARL